MKLFIILAPKSYATSNGVKNTDDLRIIRDGFDIMAMILSGLWFLWRGMWVHALMVFVAFIGVMVCFFLVPMGALSVVLLLCIIILCGFEANYFYVEHLLKNDFILLDYMAANNREMAIELYLEANPLTPSDNEKGLDEDRMSSGKKTYAESHHSDMIFGSIR